MPSKGLVRSLAASGVGPLLSQALALATVPLLFRLYTPRDFGVWASVQAGALISGSLASFRFDLALVLERRLRVAGALFYAVVALVLTYSAVVALLIALSSEFLNRLGVNHALAALGWIWLVLVGLAVVTQSWLMREGAFMSISIAAVLNAAVTSFAQLLGGFGGSGTWLIIGSILGQASALVWLLLCVARSAQRPAWRSMTFCRVYRLLNRYRRFPQFSLPFTVLSLLRERAPIFIIGAFSAPAVVGLYSQAWRLTHFPSGLTSAALRPVFFHRTATEGLPAQGKAVDQLVKWLLLASSPWVSFVVFGKHSLFNLMLGSAWEGAGALAAVLVLPAALFAITNWIDRLLDAVGRQDINLKLEMLAAFTSAGGLWAALATGASVMNAVLLQSAALAVSYIWLVWVCYGVAGWPRSAFLTSLCEAFALGVLTYAFLDILGLILSQALVLALGAASASLISVSVLIMMWNKRI